jgi:hypothetical protein
MEDGLNDQGVRGFIDWQPDSKSRQLVERILTLVNYYTENGYPAPTVRDVFYDLLGQYGYVKSESFKRSVYRFLRLMRRTRSEMWGIGFEQINDDSFDTLDTRTHIDPSDFWRDVSRQARTYHKDLATNQPTRVVVFTEGAGAVRQFYEVAKDYTVPVYSPGGWDSINLKYETARDALEEYEAAGRQTVILHAGDFDPDGVDLFRVFGEDVHAFVEGLDSGVSAAEVIAFKRVMLLPEQIDENKKTPIDPSKIKKRDHRGRRWAYSFKAELQALTLSERLVVMRQAIEREVDGAQLEEDRRANEEECTQVQKDSARLAEE